MNVEINLTMRCNSRCVNCNRLCDRFPGRTEDLSVAQMERFVEQGRITPGTITSVKVVGGEPALHPHFANIYDLFIRGLESNAFRDVRISTNWVDVPPVLPFHPKIRWMGTALRQKRHIPYLWSPVDLGYNVVGPCKMPFRCGISLDAFGYLPCSAAIMIARGFRLEHLYRSELPDGVWGMEELCKHCTFGMPRRWQREHCYRLGRTPAEARQPTAAWKDALARLENWQPPALW